MPSPTLIAVVVAWNGCSDTLECVGSLLACDWTGLRVMVVDNGSTDGTAATLAACGSRVEVLDAGGNRGYAGGGNLGMAEAFRRGADMAFLLNNDTVVEPACPGVLAAAAADPTIGVAAPAIYLHDQPDVPWFLGSTLDMVTGSALHANEARGECPSDAPWVTGCAMLVSRSAFERTGGFDERLFAYCEDVEWSLRLREQGYRLVVVPEARICHKVSRAFGVLSAQSVYYGARNNLMVVRAHWPPGMRRPALRRTAWRHIREALRLARNDPRRCGKLPLYAVRGVADFVRGRTGRM